MRTVLDRIALIVILIGALNWLCIGLFQLDLVATLFGGLYSISLLFRPVPEET